MVSSFDERLVPILFFLARVAGLYKGKLKVLKVLHGHLIKGREEVGEHPLKKSSRKNKNKTAIKVIITKTCPSLNIFCNHNHHHRGLNKYLEKTLKLGVLYKGLLG